MNKKLDRERFLELKNQGLSKNEISKIMCCHLSTTHYYLSQDARVSKQKRQVEKRREKKREYVKLLGGKCQICGYDKYLGALQFHHKNPEEKEFEISRYSLAYDKIIEELKKCILLCANCHAEVEGEVVQIPV